MSTGVHPRCRGGLTATPRARVQAAGGYLVAVAELHRSAEMRRYAWGRRLASGRAAGYSRGFKRWQVMDTAPRSWAGNFAINCVRNDR